MNTFTGGINTTFSSELNTNFNKGLSLNILNSVRQMQDRLIIFSQDTEDLWCEAYVDSNGQGNSVDLSETGAEFDTNKYKVPDIYSLTEYIIIEATSYTGWTNGTNNTYVNKIDTGKWIVWCDTGTDAVQRAQIHKSLWYGSTGSNQLISDFTTVTAVKTSHANDVDKRALYYFVNGAPGGGGNTSFTLTFNDTTNNTDSSSWSSIGIASGRNVSWSFPSGNIRNSTTTTSDELGTDLSSDEYDNPANAEVTFFGNPTGGTNDFAQAIILCEGTSSWGAGVGFPANYTVQADVDYTADNSIPIMTAAGTIVAEVDSIEVAHDIPTGSFSSTCSNIVGKALVADFETGASIQHKITNATEDSGWIEDGEVGSFTAFTSEPLYYFVRLTPKGTSPTAGYPSIKGSGVIAE